MEIIFKKDTIFNGKYYFTGDKLEDFSDLDKIWKLNEKGNIEPLSYKEFLKLKEENKWTTKK